MGEGWLLTAEMLELAHENVKNIVCTQPFGCLPNHIVGKGMICLLYTSQKDFLAVLEAGKRIGLSASAENLLIPRKSVTAVLGLADYPVTGALAGCRTCALRGKCEFRRRGTTCFTE